MDETLNRSSQLLFIKRLFELGSWHFENNRLSKAKQAFNIALERTTALGNRADATLCHLNLSNINILLKDYDAALQCLVSAQTLSVAKFRGEVAYNLAVTFEKTDDALHDAAEAYEEALNVFSKQSRSSSDLAKCALKAALCYLEAGNGFKAHECFDTLISIYEQEGLGIQKAIALCLKSSSLVAIGDKSGAMKAAEESLKLASKFSAETKKGYLYLMSELLSVYARCHQWETAFNLNEKMNSVYKTWKRREKLRGVYLQNKGALLNSLHKYQEAAEVSEQAADLFGRQGNRQMQCHAFQNGFFSRGKSGDFESAEKNLLLALQAAKDADMLKDQWQIYEGLGSISYLRSQFDQAKTYFQKSIRLANTRCASDTERDRLISKLSSCLEIKVQHMNQIRQGGPIWSSALIDGANTPSVASLAISQMSQAAIKVENHRRMPSTDSNQLLQRARSNRQPTAQVTSQDSTSAQVVIRRKKARRSLLNKKRRDDRESHPIHKNSTLIHRGLHRTPSPDKIYQSTEYVNRSRSRRQDSVKDFVQIKGLAVDQIDGPRRKKRDRDSPDAGCLPFIMSSIQAPKLYAGNPVYSVRPAREQPELRQSSIKNGTMLDTGSEEIYNESIDEDSSITDVYDCNPDESEDFEFDEIRDDEVEPEDMGPPYARPEEPGPSQIRTNSGQRPQPTPPVTRRQSAPVMRRSLLNESPAIRPNRYESSDDLNANKKRFTRRDLDNLGRSNSTSKLLTHPILHNSPSEHESADDGKQEIVHISEEDENVRSDGSVKERSRRTHENVVGVEREIHSEESDREHGEDDEEAVREQYDKQLATPTLKQTDYDSTDPIYRENPDTDLHAGNNKLLVDTYMKPDGLAEPLYATVYGGDSTAPKLTDTAPDAPPLPRRNAALSSARAPDVIESETTDNEQEPVSTMPRGQRESMLAEQHVNMKARGELPTETKPKGDSNKSRACVIM